MLSLRSRGTGTTVPARLAACLVLALVLAALNAGDAGAVRYQHESYTTFQQQLAGGEIVTATFNKKAHTVHLFLKDGHYALVSYPSHEEPALAAQLRAKGVVVTVEKKKTTKTAVHHKLRYIAGGIALIVIAVVAGVLLTDRRRKLSEEAGADKAPAPPASSPADPE